MTTTKPRMKPKIKEEWIAALISGEYKQTTSQLYNEETGGYCCLGVLCDIVTKRTKRHIPRSSWLGDSYPPVEVTKYVGLSPDPRSALWGTSFKDGDYTLDELNDGSGVLKPRTFKQIAKIIERDF